MAQSDYDTIERRGRPKTRTPKKTRRKASEDGRYHNLGNSHKNFCTHCRPTLSNRLSRRSHTKNELKDYKNDNGGFVEFKHDDAGDS